jgi:transposase InsO family protein
MVAIDKFFKWIEVWSLANIKSEQTVAFFMDIIHRFEVPNSIITDNGTQFIGKKFLGFCNDYHIRVDWSAMAHPRSNGQVERVNDMIGLSFDSKQSYVTYICYGCCDEHEYTEDRCKQRLGSSTQNGVVCFNATY